MENCESEANVSCNGEVKCCPDLEKRFTYHAPKNDQPERYVEIREAAKKLAYLISGKCPDSRERSVALTNLEQSVFWANASIARNE